VPAYLTPPRFFPRTTTAPHPHARPGPSRQGPPRAVSTRCTPVQGLGSLGQRLAGSIARVSARAIWRTARRNGVRRRRQETRCAAMISLTAGDDPAATRTHEPVYIAEWTDSVICRYAAVEGVARWRRSESTRRTRDESGAPLPSPIQATAHRTVSGGSPGTGTHRPRVPSAVNARGIGSVPRPIAQRRPRPFTAYLDV